MKLNDLWRTILDNWPIKVFSLLLAIGVYVIISFATLNTRTVEIPLEVRFPAGYEAASTVADSVMLHIRADERYIGMIDPTAIEAVVDYSWVSQEGVATAPVLLHAEPSFVSIDVSFTTQPETLRVLFKKKAQQQLDNPVDGER
jgi:pyridoxine 5'-phosphate synthase PdxJ